MKKILLLFIFSCLYAQKKDWYLEVFKNNPDELVKNLESRINKGYLPLALDLDKKFFYFIMVKNKNLKIQEWSLIFIEYKNLNAKASRMFLDGWTASAMSFKDDGVYIFFLKTKDKVKSWKIDKIKLNKKNYSTDLKMQITKYKLDDYEPKAISYLDNNLITLYIKEKSNMQYEAYDIITYKNNGVDIIKGIEKEYKEGFMPYGLAIIDSKYIAVSYLKIKS